MSGSTLKKSSIPEKDLDISSLTEESGGGMDDGQVRDAISFVF
jgi:hypothetical protein